MAVMPARTMALGFLLLGACGGGDGAERAVVRDSAGVRIVESARPRWDAGDGWRVDTAPLLTIGTALEGNPAAQFTRIAGVVRLSDGSFVVADDGTGELRIFSADGAHLRTTGGKGNGPGEYANIASIQRLPGDTLLVSGLMPPRMGLHSPNGSFLRTPDLPRVDGGRPAALVHRFPDGGSLLRRGGFTIVQPRTGTWTDSATLYHAAAGSDSAATFGTFPAFRWNGSGGQMASVGFAPRPSIVAFGERVFVGFPERYEIAGYTPHGRLELLIRRSWTPVPVDQAARDAHRKRTLGDDPTPIELERMKAQTYAEHHPAYDEIRIDAEGNLWVREPRLDLEALSRYDPPPAPSTWGIFDTTGIWLGDVVLPAGLEPRDIGRDHVTGVWRDEDGVSYVRVHRLVKP